MKIFFLKTGNLYYRIWLINCWSTTKKSYHAFFNANIIIKIKEKKLLKYLCWGATIYEREIKPTYFRDLFLT